MTTESITDLVEGDLLAQQRALEGTLLQLFEARQAKNEATKDDEKLSAPIKQFLGLNLDMELVDGEHGIAANLQRRGATDWDLRPLEDTQLLALARAGLLTVRTTAFDALRKAAPSTTWDDVQNKRGVRIEGETWSLQVKKTDA